MKTYFDIVDLVTDFYPDLRAAINNHEELEYLIDWEPILMRIEKKNPHLEIEHTENGYEVTNIDLELENI